MMNKQCTESTCASSTSHLQKVLRIHFDPDFGTPYWLDKADSLGISPIKDICTFQDLHYLGSMEQSDLARRPLIDFIPRCYHNDVSEFIIGQTGGTTGFGVWTAYRQDEFEEAFVKPFLLAAKHVSFPIAEQWLFIGPTGPHIIGKVVPHLARGLRSPDPFSVDFDASWARTISAGSFACTRYLVHVIEQAMRILEVQPIGVLFTTPVVLRELALRMSSEQCNRIRGVHYGGMELSPLDLETFQTVTFPNAVHISGYGNTLFGCCLELNTNQNRQLEYFPYGKRLFLEVVDAEGNQVKEGEFGQVRMTRLDESFLIVRKIERDVAQLIATPCDAPVGFSATGIRNPHTPTDVLVREEIGLY